MLMLIALACTEPKTDTTPTATDTATDSSAAEPSLQTLLLDAGAGDDVLLHPDGFLVASDPIGEGRPNAPEGDALREIHLDGTVQTYAEGLVLPLGNDIDADGNVYAAEWGGEGRVFRVTPDRTVSTLVSGLSYASNIVAHPDQMLYVTAWGEDTIYRVDPATGEREPFAEGISKPVGLALDTDQTHLLVSSFSHGAVHRIAPDGTAAQIAELPDTGEGTAADLVATDGGVFVTSFSGNCVYRIDSAGAVEVVAGTGEAGGADGAPLEATLRQPNGIAASADGRTLFIQEFGGALRVLSLG